LKQFECDSNREHDLLRKLIDQISSRAGQDEVIPEAADHRVLFVCMGNICRSPTAEGAFRAYAREHAPELDIHIDSAGTHAYHAGEPPDARARRAAERRGIDLSPLRARRVTDEDFETFELILAMDLLNLETLRERCPAERHDRLHLFLDFAGQAAVREVPDPYYGGLTGFERVLDLVEAASAGLLEHLLRQQRD
jgi:protein-tyrosine phosphatase